MTYLQLVNAVLRRLRENEVASVSSTSYSKLIGDFVNEARHQVQSAWDWSALRTTLTVTTAADTFNYELNGANNRSSVLNVLNDTSDWEMQLKESAWFDRQFLMTDPQKGAPLYYNFNGVSADGDVQVDLFPIPDGVYTLRFNMVVRSSDLTSDSDTVVVPTRPIILLATAMAIEERGEDGGQQSINAYQMGQNALADEIAFDDARSPEGTIWYTA
jgi:hypothetical protein